ncbi:LacI family transcriptional regulator [Actinotalea sp. M2MS4P-6]|uniref:LacI family DNA-binding transcriptional regulator n=1 Tax=Actinotalea sp. M2MS4P-6 TaxID=2983762 RepID=UPI0021E3C3A1|nr:LacI family DNA-binding transcriptional regulator [Actinotalea sp. M2MS4P-6]MCV2394202.1 LacI family transcriptional regulator [Actinotalea sp. M2MS4P-6]
MTTRRAAPPRPRGPRLSDVAAHAGVSPGTVSHVLNHPHKVRPETKARVLAAIEELGFSRNGMASALARGDTLTIGLVVPSLGNSLFVDVARGAQAGTRAAGYYLNLATADDDEELFGVHMRRMNEVRASGMIIAPLSAHPDGVAQSRRAGCPVVVLNHDDGNPNACRVLIDNRQVGVVAVEHMVSLGRRRVWFVHAEDHRQPVALRLAGVRDAAARLPLGVTLEEVPAESIWATTGTVVARRIAALPADERPDGVIAVTDEIGMAIVNELTASGIDVPGEIAVMGCDHNSAAWGAVVPLTSVSMEGEEMGREGARLLLDELRAGPDHEHETVVLTPHLAPRASTVGRAGAGVALAGAIDF